MTDFDPTAYLTSHASARIWRHVADAPDTSEAARAVLLEHLTNIEADPPGADWMAAYTSAYYNCYYDDAPAADALCVSAAYAENAGHYSDAGDARCVAKDAVQYGCAGTDRIGLALTLLADPDEQDPTAVWELSGLVTQTLQEEIAEKAAGKTSP